MRSKAALNVMRSQMMKSHSAQGKNRQGDRPSDQARQINIQSNSLFLAIKLLTLECLACKSNRFSRACLKVEVIPIGNLAADTCDKLDHAILGDHHRYTLRTISAKPISRTVPSPCSLRGFWNPLLGLGIQCSVDDLTLIARHLDLDSVPQHRKTRVQQEAAVDGRHIGKPSGQIEILVGNAVRHFFAPFDKFEPTD